MAVVVVVVEVVVVVVVVVVVAAAALLLLLRRQQQVGCMKSELGEASEVLMHSIWCENIMSSLGIDSSRDVYVFFESSSSTTPAVSAGVRSCDTQAMHR